MERIIDAAFAAKRRVSRDRASSSPKDPRSSENGEKPASVLAEPFGVSFAAISQHLKILKEADLVSERRDGRQRIYHLHPKPLREVVSWVDEFESFFNARLDALAEQLDRKHGRKKG